MAKDSIFSNNLMGYFFILFPAIAFLSFANTLPRFFCVIAASIIGISFSVSCFSYIRYKHIVSILFALSLSGFFITYYNQNNPLIFIGITLSALSLGGQIYGIFIEQILIPRNDDGAFTSPEKGFLISASVITAIGFSVLIRRAPFSFSLTASLVLFFCALISIKEAKLRPFVYMDYKHKRHSRNKIKVILFFSIISISTAIVWTMATRNFPIQSNPAIVYYLFLGTILGPLLITTFVRLKGIYSGCVLLIFLAETALLFTTLYKHVSFLPAIGFLGIGLITTSTLCLCPLLTHYLFGPGAYYHDLSDCLLACLSGGLLLLPLSHLDEGIILSTQLTVTTIGMLLISFFALFSAWSHRLVLLK